MRACDILPVFESELHRIGGQLFEGCVVDARVNCLVPISAGAQFRKGKKVVCVYGSPLTQQTSLTLPVSEIVDNYFLKWDVEISSDARVCVRKLCKLLLCSNLDVRRFYKLNDDITLPVLELLSVFSCNLGLSEHFHFLFL